MTTNFGKAVKALRTAHKLHSKALAAKLGVSSQTLSNWECGRVVPRGATMILMGIVHLLECGEVNHD